MYEEDDLLPISALQHLAFCERQWALIHLEQQWRENVLTVEGKQMHDRVHDVDESECRGSVRIVRSLRLRSLRLGLVGQADVVEFDEFGEEPPRIIEYKHGKPKIDHCDDVQLCAQALCLEETLHVTIPSGEFFYGKPRRRHRVLFSEELRKETEGLAARLHELTEQGETPPARYEPKCDHCSLIDICLPKTTAGKKSAARYLRGLIALAIEEGEGRGATS